MDISAIQEFETVGEVKFDKCICYMHENHRWCLPIAFAAQQQTSLPRPCTLVMFDAHDDCKIPDQLAHISESRRIRNSLNDLIDLCREKLDIRNCDWIIAGMELGLIGDVVVYGVRDPGSRSEFQRTGYEDTDGAIHRIKFQWFPGGDLQYHGDLSDRARQCTLKELWDILDWRLMPDGVFKFGDQSDPIWLNIDLDCFKIEWWDHNLPWPDEVFQKEFEVPSDYQCTHGWSGKAFFQELVKKAGLITIAREPRCCDGDTKSDIILTKLNRFLFDNKLNI